MEDRTGQMLKGYELHEQVGAGGFGVVYRATQPLLKREVAIKAILPEHANQPDFIRRFEVEAELVARLEHPHIIPLYDYWREPDGAYLVMRWLRGGSMRGLLDKSGALPLDRIADILDQIAAALMVAHRSHVVHRDIKPDNVLLDEDGNAYLADFGIAKNLDDIAEGGVKSTLVGSPAYFAPEQIRGDNITPRTDLYSLGVMLFEMLVGTRPFPQATTMELIMKHLNEPLPLLHTVRGDLPRDLDDVLQKATEKDPDDRYPDVLSMAAAFRAAIRSELPVTRPDLLDTDTLHDIIVDVPTMLTLPAPENPYKGLRAFQEADAADFFGRQALVEGLIARLNETGTGSRFLAVIGPSGSGKSSVVRAGLVPAIRRGALPGSDKWFIAQMIPGAHPLEELEVALLRVAVNPPGSLAEQLREDQRGLLRAVRRILPDDSSELLLVIDQFEEVFTQLEDEAARTHFLDSLYNAVTDPKSQLRLIVTLRADFYDRPLQYRAFGELLRKRMETVLPLSADELREAILAPAEQAGVQLEPGLVAALLNDVGEQPGALPLLQYALTELFERRRERTLELFTYQDIGGITGALARRAEELYEGFDEAGKAAARQLFLRLITLGEGTEDTRRRVRRAELGAIVGVDDVIEAFGRHRLLTFDRDPVTRGPTIEVAHEALIREWGRLREWIDESREDVLVQRRLTLSAAEWTEGRRDPSFLASGARLSQFEAWAAETGLALNEEERAYVRESVEQREAQRKFEEARKAHEADLERQAASRLRYLVAGLSVFLVVAVGMALFALNRQQNAETQRLRAIAALDEAEVQAQRATIAQGEAEVQAERATIAQGEAEIQAGMAANSEATAVAAQAESDLAAELARQQAAEAQSLALAANAQLVLNSGDADLALVLALNAIQAVDEPALETVRALANTAYAPGTRYLFDEHTLPILNVAISPDGRTALSAAGNEISTDREGELIQWDLTTGQMLRRLEGHEHKVTDVAYSPDGQTALSADYNGVIILWDLSTGEEIQRFQDPAGIVRRLEFSPDGKYFATGGGVMERVVKVWDLRSGEIIRRLEGHTDQLDALAYSPDGTKLLSGARNGELILWDANTGAEIQRFVAHADAVNAVAFTADGEMAASGGSDIGIVLWNVATGEELGRIETGVTYSVAFSPDGLTLASGTGAGSAGVISLWDVSGTQDTGDEIRRFVGHTSSATALAFTPDGRMILSGSNDTTLRLWYVNSAAETLRIQNNEGIESAVYSPDETTALAGLRGLDAVLWDLESGEEIRRLVGHEDYPRSVAFTPDGTRAVTGSLDGTLIVWDVASGEEIRRFEGHTGWVTTFALTPDGERVLSGALNAVDTMLDAEVILWELETGEEIYRFPGTIMSVAISPDGERALIGQTGLDAIDMVLRDLDTGDEISRTTIGSDLAWDIAFSPDGQTALLAMGTGTMRLWDVNTNTEIRRFVGHTDIINSVAFSPDGRTALSGSNDGLVILWDVERGAELHRYIGHMDYVRSVAFSSDGTRMLSGARDSTLREWVVFSTPQDLIEWTLANRYIRELTCAEREQYRIEPLCRIE